MVRYSEFEEWPDGDFQRVYAPDSEDAKKHTSGWAMRNTNNHNVSVMLHSPSPCKHLYDDDIAQGLVFPCNTGMF